MRKRFQTETTTINSRYDRYENMVPEDIPRPTGPDPESWRLINVVAGRNRGFVAFWEREKLCRTHEDCLDDGEDLARLCLLEQEAAAVNEANEERAAQLEQLRADTARANEKRKKDIERMRQARGEKVLSPLGIRKS